MYQLAPPPTHTDTNTQAHHGQTYNTAAQAYLDRGIVGAGDKETETGMGINTADSARVDTKAVHHLGTYG
jgi:hypothetical protein